MTVSMEVIRWKIYYDDGTTFRSDDGTPKDAPTDGIQGIVEWFNNNTVHLHGGDFGKSEYFLWSGDCWVTGDRCDLEKWLRRELPQLKYGRFASNTVYQKILEDMSDGSSRW